MMESQSFMLTLRSKDSLSLDCISFSLGVILSYLMLSMTQVRHSTLRKSIMYATY